MNSVISKIKPDTQIAHESFVIHASVKRPTIEKVFGYKQVAEFFDDIEKGRHAYLNRYGANVHFVGFGGALDDQFINLKISGHYQGEANITLQKLYGVMQ